MMFYAFVRGWMRSIPICNVEGGVFSSALAPWMTRRRPKTRRRMNFGVKYVFIVSERDCREGS
jgi:hypothetical protein